MRISLFLIVLFMSSCKWWEPKKPQLDINKMKVIVWQLMQADEYYSRASLLDSTWGLSKKNVQMYQQIFTINKVDRIDFYNTIDYLERHPIEFKQLMDSVNEVSKREKRGQFQH